MSTAQTDHVQHSHVERYRIVSARDRRFDGQFVTAVHSTGIYCRPSCPARTPKSEGITFFETSAAAHRAGFRACKRCLPEATPGSSQWNTREDLASRAMRLILDGYVDREGVAGLARHLGYSERQLDRILLTELGAGPKALSRAHRAQSARLLLTSTTLSVSDVAFAAGFGSIRQCNDTVREVFGLTPTQIRRSKHSVPGAPSREDGDLRLWLPAREPFDADGLLIWVAARAVPGPETSEAGSYARLVRLPGGPAWFCARPTAGDRGPQLAAGVDVRVRVSALADLPQLISHVRALFDLDADPAAVDDVLGRSPELRGAVRATPGIRVPGSVDPHELVIRAIIGQQISVAAARTALTRLVADLGTPVPHHISAQGRLFPTMASIADHGADVLRGPRGRIDTVIRTAAALAEGSLVVDRGQDIEDLRASLQAIPGIGPWTAGYVGLRVRQHPNILLPGDSAIRAGAHRLGLPSTATALTRWAQATSPWQSYLTMHLWRAAASPKKASTPS